MSEHLGVAGFDVLLILLEHASSDRRWFNAILRSHVEVGTVPEKTDLAQRPLPEDVRFRQRLDGALDELTRLQIGFLLGGTPKSLPLADETKDALIKLCKEPAFLRYLDAYDYFAVRMLAMTVLKEGRLSDPAARPGGVRSDGNCPTERVLLLPSPPGLKWEEEAISKALANFKPLDALGPEELVYLRMLDGFIPTVEEPREFELWLRGLRPSGESISAAGVDTASTQEKRFKELQTGLLQFTDRICSWPAFDSASSNTNDNAVATAIPERWSARHPEAARIGLFPLYWIARTLRAEISSTGLVVYASSNWLGLLCDKLQRDNAAHPEFIDKLRSQESTLRGVLEYTCELIQNAVAIAQRLELESDPEFEKHPHVGDVVSWTEAFDAEQREIYAQRLLRNDRKADPLNGPPAAYSTTSEGSSESARKKGWSERVLSGWRTENLTGLGLSGGGIRSATFNLGVLQGLQQWDLLQQIDYVSSVSGGGFISSWLTTGSYRMPQWLNKHTEWRDSISHLRKYSNYLSPRSGVLSSDFWTMCGVWMRNAVLVQLSGLAWVLLAFAIALCTAMFAGAISPYSDWANYGWSGAICLLLLIASRFIVLNLKDRRTADDRGGPTRKRIVLISIVAPVFLAAWIQAGWMWRQVQHFGVNPSLSNPCDCATRAFWAPAYSSLLGQAWKPLLPFLVVATIIFAIFAFLSIKAERISDGFARHPAKNRKNLAGFLSVPIALAALYLSLCGVLRLLVYFLEHAAKSWPQWTLLVTGLPLVLLCYVLSANLFVGVIGRDSHELVREWWTRVGIWIGIFSLIYLVITGTAVFAPYIVVTIFKPRPPGHHGLPWKQIGLVISWLGTTVGGLTAGSSDKTGSKSPGMRTKALELFARVAGFLSIAGFAALASFTLYTVLTLISDGNVMESPFKNLSAISQQHGSLLLATLILAIAALLFSWRFDLNTFSLTSFYRIRLARCYQGATRWMPGGRRPHRFTNFDHHDDMALSDLQVAHRADFAGPFPIFNTALNLGGSVDLSVHTRHSSSFTMTPLRCGSDRYLIGYARTGDGANGIGGKLKVGQAVAISGAAASPNMGYNTSPLVSFLLTMFNVRLGWWFPNPGKVGTGTVEFNLRYLLLELFGMAGEKNKVVNLSDGGHFENLGIYELVRRRCRFIIACDAECDNDLSFGSLGNVARLCETDFGARIDIDVNSIRRQENGFSLAHATVGKITYSDGSIGTLLYIKASLTGDEPVGVAQYHSGHPDFPHQTTADQFFSEDQFDSYRQLGEHIMTHILRASEPGVEILSFAKQVEDRTAPVSRSTEAFQTHTTKLNNLWHRCALSGSPLADELMQSGISSSTPTSTPLTSQEYSLGLQALQLMEDVYLSLDLENFWSHPDNRGWALLFTRWARGPRFRTIYLQSQDTFGVRFVHFCERRLGMNAKRPLPRA